MNFKVIRGVFVCDLGIYRIEVSNRVPHAPSGWSVLIYPSYPWNLLAAIIANGLSSSEEACEKAPNLVLQFLQVQKLCTDEAFAQAQDSQPKRKHALERLVENDGPL